MRFCGGAEAEGRDGIGRVPCSTSKNFTEEASKYQKGGNFKFSGLG